MKQLNHTSELPVNTLEIDHFLKYHSLSYSCLKHLRDSTISQKIIIH